jgi:hypothetical protein
MPDTPGRPKLVVAQLAPYGVVLELRCWSEEEARDLYQRVEVRQGFAVSRLNAAGQWMCSKEGRA